MKAPRRARDPRTRSTRWLIALGVASVALFSVLVPLQTVNYGTALPVAMLLGAAVCGGPLLAVPYPRTAIVLFSVAAFMLPLLVSPTRNLAWPWPWSVPALIAFALIVLVAAVVHGWRAALIPWGASNAASLVTVLTFPDADAAGAVTANLIVTASITATALLIGILIAGRIRVDRELSESLQLTEIEQSRRLLVEERTRIARELHDVVAHGMSVIQVQASTARYRLPELSDAAVAEFEDIAEAARGSLAEMRRLLGVLRTDDQGRELAPQQGIDDIPALVESLGRAGAVVTLTIEPTAAPAPPSVQVTAFRIVQEALSNAVRHAPGAAVDVEVAFREGATTIHVHDDGVGPDAEASSPATGHGLLGMRERVALLGGSLRVGADSEGGWTVSAILPWPGSEEEGA